MAPQSTPIHDQLQREYRRRAFRRRGAELVISPNGMAVLALVVSLLVVLGAVFS